jgi:hypothetical protein
VLRSPKPRSPLPPLDFLPSVRAAVLMAQLSPTTRSLERLPGLFCISSFQPTPARIREPGPAAGLREAHLGSALMAMACQAGRPGQRRPARPYKGSRAPRVRRALAPSCATAALQPCAAACGSLNRAAAAP